VLLLILLASSVALALSVAQVYLRDTRYFVTAATLGWLWITPVVYPYSQVHGVLRALLVANPMSGVVELLHAAVYTTAIPDGLVLTTVGWTAGLAVLAVALHSRYDRSLVDLL
jgi:ABC-type polysaccharide/polyol phosphate export permease